MHARVSGGVSVGWARPAYRPSYRHWSVGGRVYVGGGYYPYYSYYGYYPRYRYYYYYTPVPSYYGVYSSAYYYPVQPAPQTTVAAVAPAPRPELPKLGIGLFGGGVSVEGVDQSSDVGLLGRVRLTTGLLVEGELGKTSYENDLRVDRRLGASLVYEIGAYNKFAPYVLAGLGVQQAEVGDGQFSTTQNFGEIGVGLRYAFTPHFHVMFDVRAGSRDTVSQDAMPTGDVITRSVTPPSESSNESEEYTRARLAAMLYF
ncbi:MAG TPA: outer membrane beta-barrel protein [Kofleriaceae bacterium]|nr:outer membrane beta-barrel protein [Kofleriaceae bacterium]